MNCFDPRFAGRRRNSSEMGAELAGDCFCNALLPSRRSARGFVMHQAHGTAILSDPLLAWLVQRVLATSKYTEDGTWKVSRVSSFLIHTI